MQTKNREQLTKRGILGKLTKPIASIFKKKVAVAKELETMLKCIKKIEELKKDEDFKEGLWDMKDEVVQSLLTKLFTSLKDSELINPILRFSLTDENVRQGLIDITIQLLQADVIPWYEIFVALKDSGLAVDVITYLLTDPETRRGEIDLVLELIPRLIEEGVLNLDDLIKRIPQLRIPKVDIPFQLPNITVPKFHIPSLENGAKQSSVGNNLTETDQAKILVDSYKWDDALFESIAASTVVSSFPTLPASSIL